MKITKYEFNDIDPKGWSFDPIEFGNVNLIVGNSGMGKTRILNTLFNLGSEVVKKSVKAGIWNLRLSTSKIEFTWKLNVQLDNQLKPFIQDELLEKIIDDKKEILVERKNNEFIFKGERLPKLSKTETCISLLRDEDEIHLLYEGFTKIIRRRFFESELSENCKISGFPFGLFDKIVKGKTNPKLLFPQLHDGGISLNGIQFILQKYYNTIFKKICDLYRSIFPFIDEIKVLDFQELEGDLKIPGQIPVFCIKERGVNKWLKLDDLSSGMQKVLLIITDIFTMPDDSIYIIDEYENSLGINAINFFPELLIEENNDIQFFITSHHPYLINKVPISNWYVFHRTGPKVDVLYGEKLKQRIGTSKQQAFIKLINDSFFIEGKE